MNTTASTAGARSAETGTGSGPQDRQSGGEAATPNPSIDTPTPGEIEELLPCPNPWCEAAERDGDFSPAVRLHHFGNYRVVCTSCILEGPLRPTEAEAIAAWNTRSDRARMAKMERALEACLAREKERAEYQGLTDCCCISVSRDAEREYDTGTCPHQIARAALTTAPLVGGEGSNG